MPRKLRIAYFVHSLRSDWNNGNAHFLRGLLNELGKLGHEVSIFEPETEWSIANLREEISGSSSLQQFQAIYPNLRILTYNSHQLTALEQWRATLSETDIVVLHEWNPPELGAMLLLLRKQLNYKLLFHDTHHRASSSPEQIKQFGIERFDGVIAFGEALSTIYRERFGLQHVWTVHEAADTSIFRPLPECSRATDVVWIGNWGDDERSAEIRQFLLQPASQLRKRSFRIYGVRYPDFARDALQQAGIRYCGYLANLQAPEAYAASGLTLHIPRQQYVDAMQGIPTIRVFEALACGIPLISAPWLDCESLFRSGDFIKVANTNQARDAIEDLLDNPQAAQAQAARGLQTVLARHTCKHRAIQCVQIFEELLK